MGGKLLGKISFNVDAYTMRLIGREDIATVEAGLATTPAVMTIIRFLKESL